MLTWYIVSLIAGGGLIFLSLFGGDHEHGGELGGHEVGHDVDHGGDHDASHEGDHDAQGHGGGPWIPFFSLRFWTYMIGIFGLTGTALSATGQSVEPATAMISAGTGFVSGLVASFLVRWLRTHEADSTISDKDMLGVRAKVTATIRDQQLGRVRATVRGELLDILATSEEPLALPEGSEVVIVSMENGRATVMPLEALFEEKQ